MCSDSVNSSIVQALLGLARNFGLQTVAEGVEDSATWSALAALGCDAIQGYYISRPVPGDDLIHWLEQHQAATPIP